MHVTLLIFGESIEDFRKFELNILMMDLFLLQTCRFSLHKAFIGGLESLQLLVDYYDVFISCLNSHYDGNHSQMIHWCQVITCQTHFCHGSWVPGPILTVSCLCACAYVYV